MAERVSPRPGSGSGSPTSRPPSGKQVRFKESRSGKSPTARLEEGSGKFESGRAAQQLSGSRQRRQPSVDVDSFNESGTANAPTRGDSPGDGGDGGDGEGRDSPLLTEDEREEIFGKKKSAASADCNAALTDLPGLAPEQPEVAAKREHETLERHTAAAFDAAADARSKLAFTVAQETVQLPLSLPPPPAAIPLHVTTATVASSGGGRARTPGRVAGANVGEAWHPGTDLIVCCCTWNMAGAAPASSQVRQLIRPNAHVICVATQENGPYVGFNTAHRAWEALIETDCLQERYTNVAAQTLWAVHIAVFVRTTDVLPYIMKADASYVKTGGLRSALGNKGGVGVSLVLSLKGAGPFKDYHRIPTEERHWEKSALQQQFEQAMAESSAQQPQPRIAGSAELNGSGGAVGAAYSPREGASDTQQPAVARPSSGRLRGSSAAPHDTHDATASTRVMPSTAAPPSYGSIGAPSPAIFMNHGGVAQRLTMLFVGAHLAAHQNEVEARNRDFKRIVAELRLGCRSSGRRWRRQFLRSNGNEEGKLSAPDDLPSPGSATATTPPTPSPSDDPSHPLRPSAAGDAQQPSRQLETAVAASPGSGRRRLRQRDVTEEFDVAFFLGDLNYRINGTKRAIENIITNHVALRPVLVNNDQLTREMQKGFVFSGFQEGPLCFRPTYKYHIDKISKAATDEYDLSKKARMPAYCDRVLFKRHPAYDGELLLTHYTDVPGVRTSDHRPVVAMFKVKTRMCDGGTDLDAEEEEGGEGICSCCC